MWAKAIVRANKDAGLWMFAKAYTSVHSARLAMAQLQRYGWTNIELEILTSSSQGG